MAGTRIFKDAFGALSSEYALYRPTYPKEMLEKVISIATKDLNKPENQLKLADIACGTGQVVLPLAKRLGKVYGIDGSPGQIEEARKRAETQGITKGIKFQVGEADKTGLGSESVDIVTIAQALHWLNLDNFFGHVREILKPNGVFAVLGYSMCQIQPEDS